MAAYDDDQHAASNIPCRGRIRPRDIDVDGAHGARVRSRRSARTFALLVTLNMAREDPGFHRRLTCLNCGAQLAGQYCSDCGQKDDPHRPTFGHFVAETFESLTHADSRLWCTLRALLVRPGLLTAEYFAGRRARYLPPIRLYIVFSVTYFLLLALFPDSTRLKQAEADENNNPAVAAPASSPAGAKPAASASAPSPAASGTLTLRPNSGSGIAIEGGAQACEEFEYRGWGRATVEPRLRAACRSIAADDGAGFGNAFLRQVPRAMFVVLPLFAIVMLAFYWRPRRLYAEHLLFLVHYHCALFAVASLELVLTAALPASWAELLGWFTLGYLVWYGLRGMRAYYQDTWVRTGLKFAGLATFYLLTAAIVFFYAGLAAALSL